MALDAAALIPVALVLIGGAISPGPSLAVVLRNTIVGGRARGVACSVGHGIGFGIYAFLAISGIALLKSEGLQWATALELAGAAFLVWIGVAMIRAPEREFDDEHEARGRDGFVEGFLIAFLNPKIFVFLTAIFSQFIDAGAYMGVGTDAASPLNMHNEAMWREMSALVESGMTPIQVISAATRTNAEILGQFDQLGTIEPGKLADIIAINGNPLQDIKQMENVSLIIKDGQIYKQ